MWNAKSESNVEYKAKLPLFQKQIRQSRIWFETVKSNWFRRCISHTVNSWIKFGTCDIRRLNRGRPGVLVKQYINFRYTGFLCLKLDIHSWLILGLEYTVVFLILVFYTSFSIIFGILEGLFRVFWYSTTPPADPVWNRP